MGDLRRFHASLWRHAQLGPELTERVSTRVVDASFGRDTEYGYGFIDDRGVGARIVGHGGGAPGVSSNLDMYPDLGLAVAVVSNYDAIASTVANRIRRMVAP